MWLKIRKISLRIEVKVLINIRLRAYEEKQL